jgi:hypothetical protein
MLGKLASKGFRIASLLNTMNILLSANPQRILRHLLRKNVYKRASKIGRHRKGAKKW